MFAVATSQPPTFLEPPTASVTMERRVVVPEDPRVPDLDVDGQRYFLFNSVTVGPWADQPVADKVVASYRPRTALGAKLLALRNAYIEGGGELLSMDELDLELRARRGELDDD